MKYKHQVIRSRFFCLVGCLLGSCLAAEAAFWSTNDSLVTGRYNHTATLLANGKVFVSGGTSSGGYLASTEVYDPLGAKWSAGPNMSTNRELHTATLLQNGKVLIAGGYAQVGFFQVTYASAEIYDPVTGTSTPTGSMLVDRASHTATLLANGKVLVTGGLRYDPVTFASTNPASAEIYDPATGQWQSAGSLSTGRQTHTATLLQNGKVLVAGGYFTNYLSSAELFDPTTSTWSPAALLPAVRSQHCATMLANGKVLVAGGVVGSATNSAALYDPGLNTWSVTGSMTARRGSFAMNLLPNGKVLASGGGNGLTIYASAETYDPATGTWTATASMNFARAGATATVLANGRVLVSSGYILSGFDAVPVASSETYDSAAESWSAASLMLAGRYNYSMTPLANGKILLAGGTSTDNYTTNGAEIYDPGTSNFTATGSMQAPHYGHFTQLLPNGKVLLVDFGTNNTAAELYDPKSGSWTAANPGLDLEPINGTVLLADGRVMMRGITNTLTYNPTNGNWTQLPGLNSSLRSGGTMTLLTNGTVLLAGGHVTIFSSDSLVYQCEIFDPQTGTWSSTGALTYGRIDHTANLLPNGKVLVAAGYGTTVNYPDLRYEVPYSEVYNPLTGAWTLTGPMAIPRENHASATLLNGQVLIAGGVVVRAGGFSPPTYTNGVEVFDPISEKWRLAASLPYSPGLPRAALLSNGQILVAGGATNISLFAAGYPLTAVLYNPGLGFAATNQPTLVSFPTNVGLGASATISGALFRGLSEASLGGTGNSPSDHPVVQLLALNSGWSALVNGTAWSSNSFSGIIPTNFPVGHALLTVCVNGIYSASGVINIGAGGGAALPFQLLNPQRLLDGTFRFTFTNSPGLAFTAFATTNVGTSQSNWSNLGAVSETAPGQFEFQDAGAVTNNKRFYRVRSN